MDDKLAYHLAGMVYSSDHLSFILWFIILHRAMPLSSIILLIYSGSFPILLVLLPTRIRSHIKSHLITALCSPESVSRAEVCQ